LANVQVVNVVASGNLGIGLDLQTVALLLDGSNYDPDRFPGLVYKIREPRTTMLLFHSGKVVCTGAKSPEEVGAAMRALAADLVGKAGLRGIRDRPEANVSNIVASSDLEYEIDLNSLAITLGLDRVEYEPEQFPGLVFRLDSPKVVLLLFSSGKLVCTGAKCIEDVYTAIEKTSTELRKSSLIG
jgi:transcription initiation factor TFIID TATA-box-binding protein